MSSKVLENTALELHKSADDKLDLSGNTAATEGSSSEKEEDEKPRRQRARSSTHRTSRDRSKTGRTRDLSKAGTERRARDRSKTGTARSTARDRDDDQPMMDWSNGTLRKDSTGSRRAAKTASTTGVPTKNTPQRTRSRSLTEKRTRRTPPRTRSRSLTERKAPGRTASRARERRGRGNNSSSISSKTQDDDPLSLSSTNHSTRSSGKPGCQRRRSQSLQSRQNLQGSLFALVQLEDKSETDAMGTRSLRGNRTTGGQAPTMRRTLSSSLRGTRTRSVQRTSSRASSRRGGTALPISTLSQPDKRGSIMPLPAGYNMNDSSTRSSRSCVRSSNIASTERERSRSRRRQHRERQQSEARKLQAAVQYCNNSQAYTDADESEDEMVFSDDSDGKSEAVEDEVEEEDDSSTTPSATKSTATKVFRKLKKTVTGKSKKKEEGLVGPLALLMS